MIRPASKCLKLSKHTKAPEGYIDWSNWAEKKSKTHRQIRCQGCGLYFIWVPKKKEEELMPFYSVSFGYGGPKTNFPCENEDGSMSDASKVCFAADDACEKLGKKLGLNLLHQYSFPDGSLSKYVKDARSPTALKELLAGALPEWICVHSVDEIPPNTNPWKVGFKTVEAYFGDGAAP